MHAAPLTSWTWGRTATSASSSTKTQGGRPHLVTPQGRGGGLGLGYRAHGGTSIRTWKRANWWSGKGVLSGGGRIANAKDSLWVGGKGLTPGTELEG